MSKAKSKALDFDVVVVGAGVSGLSAATTLLRRAPPSTRVAVLEAQDRVGGRTLSIAVNDRGARADLGGQWLGATQLHAHALAAELQVPLHPQYCDGRKVLDLQSTAITYTGDIPLGIGAMSLVDTQLLMMKIDRMCGLAPTDDPHLSPYARDWDAQSVDTWVSQNSFTADTRALMEACVRGVFGVEPADISLLHFLSYLHSGGGPDKLVNIRNGAQEKTFVGGAQQLSEKMAARLGSGDFKLGTLHLASPVARIEQPPEGDRVLVHTRDGQCFVARAVILAMPPAICHTIQFEPRLPPARERLHQRNFIGSIIKWLVVYDSAFWRTKGFSGEVVCDCADGPAFNVYDDCVPNADGSEQPMLVVFCNGRPALEWTKRTAAERRAAVLQQLVKWFGADAAQPRAVHEKNWLEDDWSRGCPIGIWPTGTLWSAGEALRQPVGRVHWAGTETATQHQGFIDGAISAGQRAADEVIAVLARHGAAETVAAKVRTPPAQRVYRDWSSFGMRSALAVALIAIVVWWVGGLDCCMNGRGRAVCAVRA